MGGLGSNSSRSPPASQRRPRRWQGPGAQRLAKRRVRFQLRRPHPHRTRSPSPLGVPRLRRRPSPASPAPLPRLPPLARGPSSPRRCCELLAGTGDPARVPPRTDATRTCQTRLPALRASAKPRSPWPQGRRAAPACGARAVPSVRLAPSYRQTPSSHSAAGGGAGEERGATSLPRRQLGTPGCWGAPDTLPGAGSPATWPRGSVSPAEDGSRLDSDADQACVLFNAPHIKRLACFTGFLLLTPGL